ncbi:ADP-ribosylase [Enterobacter phage vB_EhoM-IME523]|uniref:NAD--protein ADP-ribosyltransferase modB n=1 Tax=Enterobacter phage vB_EhoM-IME523 TaxID=2596709 RepID=A0A7G3KE43_9CAUD|nr:ADP-ribosylase [Enterobacter phage vB_EhoM-IME523]QEA10499.1 ADP-ribosylase [Enterobacter phage vB_EhoM-IME523]
MFNVPTITCEMFQKQVEVAYEEEKERLYIQQRVDEKFTDREQSILWLCMNDKNTDYIHELLNPIVRKHLTSTVPPLFRGISLLEANKIYDLAEGETFKLNRVTSFSSDFSTAKQFASKWHYDSQIVFRIKNCPYAFNYQEEMIQILLAAPDEEFMGQMEAKEQREDKLDMVQGECEFMLPSEATYRICGSQAVKDYGVETVYTIIDLELIEW